MRFIGVSENYHDAALSVIEDGEVVFASHSERYSKKKNDKIIHPDLWERGAPDLSTLGWNGNHLLDTPVHMSFYEQAPERGANHPRYNFKFNHHKSHCATAFYTRPWEDRDSTVMVSIDGVGEDQCAVILDNQFNLIKEWRWPKSVGLVYTVCTTQLGLRPLEDEYVVMGLSSYAKAPDEIVTWLVKWWENSPNNDDFTELKHMMRKWCEEFDDAEVASGVQAFAEYGIMQIMNEARKHGSKLVYGGGCAQNVVINSLLWDVFDDVHISISPTDAGSSLGCAGYAYEQKTGTDRLIWTPYCGHEIKKEINPKDVVEHLLSKKVCGIANGKSEFGPRALGNRSLIADVRYDVKDTVNTIKRRQKYRPFAPAILEEYVDEYFDGITNEYMQYTCKAKHDYASVTHVDGTARVQVVKKDCQSVFRKVIEEYYEKTGVPMLLNTSLNIRGRPMVNDEHDAHLWEQKYEVKVF